MVMGIVRTQYSNIGYGLLRLLLLLFLKEKEELGRYFVLRFKFGRTNVKKREGGSREGLEKRSLHFLIPYQFNLHSNGRHTGSGSSKAYGNPL